MSRFRSFHLRLARTIANLLLVPPPSLRQQQFFQRDLRFQLAYGSSQAVVTSIAFIIIKQNFNGSDSMVALLQSSVMAGLLCSLFYANFSASYRPVLAFSLPHILGWLAMAGTIFSQSASSFTWLMALASFLFAIASPLQSVIYGLVYQRSERGQAVSLLKQWQILASVIAAIALGQTLDWSQEAYRWIFLAIAIYGIWTARLYTKIQLPSEKGQLKQRPSLIQSFHCLWDDPNYSKFLSFQFILGLVNIAGVTVVQIYVNDQNLLNASPSAAAWITGVLPPLCMFLSIRVWGNIFDRISIVHFRALTSLTMAVGYLLYPFLGIYGAMLGGLVWGLGRGGGQLAWSIGVLSFAHSERSAEYMAVHTFLTGVRGVLAPYIGVWAIHSGLSPAQLFWTVSASIALTAFATAMFVEPPDATRLAKPLEKTGESRK